MSPVDITKGNAVANATVWRIVSVNPVFDEILTLPTDGIHAPIRTFQ